jgi:outer membrane biogenesis lipoprotein LolB
MQTPEKVNKQFVFKLLVLFTLLLSGAMLKSPKQESVKGSESSTEFMNPTVQKEQQQMQHIYHRLVNQGFTSASL